MLVLFIDPTLHNPFSGRKMCQIVLSDKLNMKIVTIFVSQSLTNRLISTENSFGSCVDYC